MAHLNSPTSAIYTLDNLRVLRGLNSECIDLIYLDPPFNTGKQWQAPIGAGGGDVGFNDIWGWDRVTGETLEETIARQWEEVRDYDPEVREVVEAGVAAHSPSMGSYLAWMAPRLLEMHRVLKPTGSIYLHCDPFASHYLKTLMDAVFGRLNFRNEIVWKRSNRSDGRRFGWVHDTLLVYASNDATWNDVFLPYGQDYLDRFYRERDERGSYKRADLTGPSHGLARGAPSTQPWRDHDPHSRGRVWSVPKTGAYAEWIETQLIADYRSIESIHGRLDALDAAGLIHWPKTGKGWPMLKRYAHASDGQRANDVFDDIRMVSNLSRERTGYPTQKPLALVERIISASSNPGDVVLDPFCGCATACVAAQKLGRHWIGIDVEPKAVELCRQRLRDELQLFDETQEITQPLSRDDERQLELIPTKRILRLELWRRMQEAASVDTPACEGCGESPGLKYMEVDRIIPRKLGGDYTWDNVQLLCGPCNRSKGGRTMQQWLRERDLTGSR